MAWVPVDTQMEVYFTSENCTIEGSVISFSGGQGVDSGWSVIVPSSIGNILRITALSYTAASGNSGNMYHHASIIVSCDGDEYTHVNEAPPYPDSNMSSNDPVDEFTTLEHTTRLVGSPCFYYIPTRVTSDFMYADEEFQFLIEIWVDGPTPPGGGGHKVYELDKGWSFDGNYIPHFVTFNWYFGENPTVYTTMQKVRIHGLAKGVTQLQVQTNGIQTDYREDFSEPEHLDLKSPYEFVSEEYIPATNYADLSNRGLAIQVKFEGRNTDLERPEPVHALQVLIPQSSPQGSGFSSN